MLSQQHFIQEAPVVKSDQDKQEHGQEGYNLRNSTINLGKYHTSPSDPENSLNEIKDARILQ